MNKCCEKCGFLKTHLGTGVFRQPICIKEDCPCHYQEKEEATTTDWRDRFETQFGNYTIGTNGEAQMFDTFTLYELVQDFIAKERTQAKKEFADEFRGYIHGMQCDPEAIAEPVAGYELALIRVLALLPEQES